MEICETKPDWSSLPEDIVHNILARLPLLHFQRIRAVCSAWSCLSFSRLRGICAPVSALPGFILFLSSDSFSQLSYLDLNEPSKWRCISLSYLPYSGANMKLLASSGGLLLLGSYTGELLVTNPITKQWKQLPPMKTIRDPFYTALMADVSLESFVIAVAESESRNAAATEIYESTAGQWTAGAKPARAGRWKRVPSPMSTPLFCGSLPVYCNPVYCGGAFYHLTWDPAEMVSALDLREGVWRREKSIGMVPGGTPWGVMEDEDRVIRLGISYDTKKMNASSGGADTSASVCSYDEEAVLSLWELQQDCLQWVMMRRIPQPPNSEYCVNKWRQFAMGEGFICITFLLSGTEITLDSQLEPQPGMIFNCRTSTWLSMPDLPGIPRGSSSSLFGYTASLFPL